MTDDKFIEKYEAIRKIMSGQRVDEIVHVFAYICSEMVFHHAAPKKEFIKFFIEVFDDAFKHHVASAMEEKGPYNG